MYGWVCRLLCLISLFDVVWVVCLLGYLFVFVLSVLNCLVSVVVNVFSVLFLLEFCGVVSWNLIVWFSLFVSS